MTNLNETQRELLEVFKKQMAEQKRRQAKAERYMEKAEAENDQELIEKCKTVMIEIEASVNMIEDTAHRMGLSFDLNWELNVEA